MKFVEVVILVVSLIALQKMLSAGSVELFIEEGDRQEDKKKLSEIFELKQLLSKDSIVRKEALAIDKQSTTEERDDGVANQPASTEKEEDLPAAEDGQDAIDPLEQFILTSEQLLHQEQKKLDEFNVRSTSIEEQVSFLKSTDNYQQNKISQLEQQVEKLLKQVGGAKIQKQGVDSDKADSPVIGVRTVSDYGGVTYIRWGRNVCPHSASVIYRGYSAGSHYNQAGGGSNYLCLHDTPQWNRIISGNQAERAYIYGVEYQTFGENLYSTVNNGGLPLGDNDAPCVLCHVPTRSTVIMIPGRRDCPVDWVKEYEGYLVAGKVIHSRNSFVCLDGAPESVRGGQANLDGALFYAVESQCGSLPCPLYANGYEVTCVVCTK